MKILIINYRFYISGGPERYMFNLIDLLESKGHTIIPFSINYDKNHTTDYSDYFVDPLTSSSEVFFKEHRLNAQNILRILSRSFYSKNVYNKLSKLIDDTKPDFAIVLHYLKKLSPAVLQALNDKNIHYFVRISDFLMICPNAHLIREDKICELCIKGGLFNSVKYKCVQDSFGASVVHYLATKYHGYKKYFKNIRFFAVPSKFTMAKMIEGGVGSDKLVYLPTFIRAKKGNDKILKKNQIVFVGRLERTKGVHILLEALYEISKNKYADFKTLIIGDGNKEYVEELKSFITNYDLRDVHFLGRLEKEDVELKFAESLCSVAPSIWYDNMPNSVLESFANGTPVIVPEHGSFIEIVKNGSNGLFFNPSNSKDLSNKILMMLTELDINKMAENCINYIESNHNPDDHYTKILNIYNKIT
jgi:glycosyltransferase involved in cell wall biosynthesis